MEGGSQQPSSFKKADVPADKGMVVLGALMHDVVVAAGPATGAQHHQGGPFTVKGVGRACSKQERSSPSGLDVLIPCLAGSARGMAWHI